MQFAEDLKLLLWHKASKRSKVSNLSDPERRGIAQIIPNSHSRRITKSRSMHPQPTPFVSRPPEALDVPLGDLPTVFWPFESG